jgi:hypothetical protein
VILSCLLLAVGFTAAAHAAPAGQFKMLLCANNVDASSYATYTNTASPQNPYGIFTFENRCGWSSDPAGDSAFFRIAENQGGGNAGQGAAGYIFWNAPFGVHFKTTGGWTRQPNAFNDGWRSRFWGLDLYGGGFEIFTQGAGLGSTATFAPHLWPGANADFGRFAFELSCVRPAGCDRANFNATDANTFVFTLADDHNAQVALTSTSPFMAGAWVRGSQTATWNVVDVGSGLRFERLRIDGAERFLVDHWIGCNIDTDQSTGAYARSFLPCPAGPFAHSYTFDTATLADGAHALQACAQDYGQAIGQNGTGSESCDQRAIYTDNTPPAAPTGLHIVSPNPARYLSQFGAIFSLPSDQGSPIVKAHYEIVDSAGKTVIPEQTVSGVNPTALDKITGPAKAGAYQLRVWLEDAVGLLGPVATVPIPHDTTPPGAPQDLSVASPTAARATQGFDVRWRNIIDAGSPITAVHYEVLNAAGDVAVPTKTVGGENPQAIENLETPRERGAYTLRLWLEDGEGNVGAPAKVPLAYDCIKSEVPGALTLTAGLGRRGEDSILVHQGEGSLLSGKLGGLGGRLSGAPLCVYSNVVTDHDPRFLGVAMTDDAGGYQFAIGAGPSRELTVVYRGDQREIDAEATLKTKVRPTFKLGHKVVHNKDFAIFKGAIPGPYNAKVVVVIQVKDGKGWRVFRTYPTREGGHYLMRYRLTQTDTPTTYLTRAQVRAQRGYPYEEGYSRVLPLIVLP